MIMMIDTIYTMIFMITIWIKSRTDDDDESNADYQYMVIVLFT